MQGVTQASYLKKIFYAYYTRIVTVLAVILVFVMIAGVREFINFATIEEETNRVTQEQAYRKERIAYEKTFLIPYLSSATAQFFFHHENAIMFPDEYMVVFTENDQEEPSVELMEGNGEASKEGEVFDRKQGRDQFVKNLMEEL